MKASERYGSQPREFWAHVRLVSEHLGYSLSARKGQKKGLRRFGIKDIARALSERGLTTGHVLAGSTPTRFGQLLEGYLNYRADLLEKEVEPALMREGEARKAFERLRRRHRPTCSLPMNKQKGEKRHEAYLVGIVNMLTQAALKGESFDDEPRQLTVATSEGMPVRTFSRWMDGAYPSVTNPIAVWEIKEYYGTTTFGSRVADGVYETMLDGEELAEFSAATGRRILHYLCVDDYFTWWECGRSYLCRIIDLLHMGLLNEAFFGRQVERDWPAVVRSWPTQR
jgi:hypothetical protein